MGQTIACVNQKGGVGKTTTVVSLATYLALAGHRVLVVDLDPQGNATSGLGINKADVDRSIYDVIVDGVSIRDVILGTLVDQLGLVPSSTALSGAEVELVGVDRRDRRLARSLAGVTGDYDWIFVFDTVEGPHRTVAAVARERGQHPAETMIDLALARDLDLFFLQPVANEDQDAALVLMRHPRMVTTFSDSGAHVSQLMDSSLQTHLFSHWVRAKEAFTVEQAVRMVRDGEIVSRNGKIVKVDVHTLCVHGDEATGVAVARGIRQGLEAAGIKIVPLPEMKL